MDDENKDYLYSDSPSWIISTPRLMGIALTLTRASRALLLEPDWRLSNEEQQRGRVHRFGANFPTEFIRFADPNLSPESTIIQKQLRRRTLRNLAENTGKDLNNEDRDIL
jgi:hypothetical protein